MKSEGENALAAIKSNMIAHCELRSRSLNLVASENVTSRWVREMAASDFMHRYSEWEDNDINSRWGYGLRYTIAVETILSRMASKLFQSRYCEIRPISGQVAMLATLCALLRNGDLVASVGRKNGGAWYRANQLLAYRSASLVFDTDEWNIDVDATVSMIRKSKPKVIILGASFFLFPHPVAELRQAADEAGCYIVYDGSHVLGLIAGDRWPNPLRSGADILLGSTHKTLAGPQKGLIFSDGRKIIHRVSKALFPSIIDNHHLMNSAALAVALAEMSAFGRMFSQSVIENSQALATALRNEGFDVIGERLGFTRCHQVLVRLEHARPAKAAELLESGGIFANRMELVGANGFRLGVTEITRLGMSKDEMVDVARLISRILIKREPPRVVARDVRKLMSRFQYVHFCFDKRTRAYAFPLFRSRSAGSA